MDQIYLPKNRFGLSVGSHVLIKEARFKDEEKLIFYNIRKIERIKIIIVKELFNMLKKYSFDNIIITGSFLDSGFNFNDIDIILIKNKEVNINKIKNEVKENFGIDPHLILIDSKSLLKGISIDPLFQTMLSSYISKKRFIYHVKPEIKYKLLDLSLLKSNLLTENFDILAGSQKLDLLRNLVSIHIFITKKHIITKEEVYEKIKEIFGNDIFDNLRNNTLNKKDFIKKYNSIYNKTLEIILNGVKNESK